MYPVKRLTLSQLQRLTRSGSHPLVHIELDYEAEAPVWCPCVDYMGRMVPLAYDDMTAIRSPDMRALCNLLADSGITHAVLAAEQASRRYRAHVCGESVES